MSLPSVIKQLTNLKQGYTKGLGKAPHKPVLILAVIKAFEKGEITGNKIHITPELVSYFKSYWSKLVNTEHSVNFALPFYHLKNERSEIWTLRNKPGYEFALTSSNSIRSFQALNESLEYAQLSKELSDLLQNEQTRNIIRTAIIEKYFPDFKESGITVRYDYLDELGNQVLNDPPAIYQRRIKELIENEDAEQEVFMRSGAFKNQITKLYDYTCAVTGLNVQAIANVTMVDACHIVPFAESHNDTVTNGIALCPNMHRAFDNGLISIDKNYKVIVSHKFTETKSAYSISLFRGRKIKLPNRNGYFPAQENLEKHRIRWGFE